jgi:hypothetical protein
MALSEDNPEFFGFIRLDRSYDEIVLKTFGNRSFEYAMDNASHIHWIVHILSGVRKKMKNVSYPVPWAHCHMSQMYWQSKGARCLSSFTIAT